MKGQVTAPLVGSMASSHIFKIMFVNQGKVYEVYARKVGQGRLFGFIEVEELVFGERSSVVLDPGDPATSVARMYAVLSAELGE